MHLTTMYVNAKFIFIFCGIPFCFADANGVKQDAEEKDIRKPVDRLNRNNGNDNIYNNYHKRQIDPDFSQLGQPVEPQYFQQSFGDQTGFSDGRFANQFPNPASADEEERFFLSGETTTLNPLSFGNTPTTQNPVQQQLAEEQRRFQQEIADKGLREQQEASLGVPRPRTTTTPPPPPQPFQQFDQPGEFFPDDPSGTASLPSDPQLSDPGYPYGAYNPAQAYYPTVREFRSVGGKSPRSIDRQLGSHNDVGFFSSTVSPQSIFGNLIQHSTPKEDLAQISNWLIDNLAKQVQRSLNQITESTSKRYQHSTPKPTPNLDPHYSTEAPYHYSTTRATPHFGSHYSTEPSYQHSTAKPTSNYDLHYSTDAYQQTTPKPTPNYDLHYSNDPYQQTTPKQAPNFGLHYSTEPPIQEPVYQSSPVYQSTPKTIDFSSFPNWNDIRSINTPSSTANYVDDFESKRIKNINYLDDFESKKIKNLQIIPYSTEQPNYQITASPYDNTVYQAYKQVYDIDHQTIKPVPSTTPNVDVPSFLQIINNQPSPNTVSVTSLFKSKLTELKENEKSNRQAIPQQLNILQKRYPDFQQHNRFFDQLQYNTTNDNLNYTLSTTGAYDVTPGTAIFVKVPEDEPTSTVGFLFDKTITKNLHKKENPPSKHKNSNRSAQVIKSSLVYRTPPGKRATASRSELYQNNQIDTGLLTNFLLGDSSKPLKWLLGNTQTTTSRPFVSALLNFIQKRATST